MPELGLTTSIDVLYDRVDLGGRALVDIGCGSMVFSRQLVDRGASVLAIDPDAAQARKNRSAALPVGLRFEESGADVIPVEDASLDGAVFSFSLHHVPAALYPAVFAEVRRVLNPDGFLCVIEPTDSPHNQIIRHFHDEEVVRAAAQQGIDEIAVPMFREHDACSYFSYVEYDSFDEFARRYGGKTFNDDYTIDDVRTPQVREAFERFGAPDYRFESPKLMRLLRGVRPSA